MMYSDKYEAFVLFVNSDVTKEQALALIAPAEGTAVKVNYDGDINQNGTLMIDDAQAVYDLYSNRQSYLDDIAFVTVPMLSRLAADVNGDGEVNVLDGRLIVNMLINANK